MSGTEINVAVPQPLHKQIKKIAQREERSVKAVTIRLLKRGLELAGVQPASEKPE